MSIDRRDFFKGAAATLGVAAVAGIAGCSSSDGADELNQQASAAWDAEPTVIDESSITETKEYDIVVVGGGLSGAVAAAAAAQEGAKVAVLEKNSVSRYAGCYFGIVNSQFQLNGGVEREDETRSLIEQYQGFECSPNGRMLSVWANQSGSIFDWLIGISEQNGVESAILMPKLPDWYNPDEYPLPKIPGSIEANSAYFFETGKESSKPVIAALMKTLVDAGGEIFYSTPGKQLVQDDSGKVTGVIAVSTGGETIKFSAAKAVIICTGDFGGNPEMCETFLAPRVAEGFKEFTIYTSFMDNEDLPDETLNTGDGHKMCVWAGGQMEQNPVSTMGWGSQGQFLSFPFMMVNSVGKRFQNETIPFFMLTYYPYDQPGADKFGVNLWQIVDSNFKEQVDAMKVLSPVGETAMDDATADSIRNLTVTAYKADTLDDLASQTKIPAENLKAEVARYNELCELGKDLDYGKPAEYLAPIKEPPFYAIFNTHNFAVTVGGVYCDERLRVMSGQTGIPIEGLFAAGNVVGKRFGGVYDAARPGLSNALALTHGYLAGKNAAGA